MGNCIVVVQFDLPKRTEEQAIRGGTGSAPTYRNLASKGLIRKDYLNGETGGTITEAKQSSIRCLTVDSAGPLPIGNDSGWHWPGRPRIFHRITRQSGLFANVPGKD